MRLPVELTDQQLIRQAQAGEFAALDVIFLRHHQRVFAFLARWLGDTDAAHDIVQDTFLRALIRRDAAPPHDRLLPWLIRIARNIAIDHYRHGRHLTMVDDHDTVADRGPLPLDRLTAAERDSQLAVALGAIAPAHREVLLLRAVEGLGHHEIGMAVGCSEATARVRVHRATVALRAAWFSRFGGADD